MPAESEFFKTPWVSGATVLTGVIGFPVAHSLSPVIHQFWAARHGLDGVYVPLPVAPDRLESVVTALAACGFRGLNVTVPHKKNVLAFCDVVTPHAQWIQSANLLSFRDGKIHADSSDGHGFREALAAAAVSIEHKHVLLLGAGGAAAAILYEIAAQNPAKITLANRTTARAEELVRCLELEARVHIEPFQHYPRLLETAELFINATSLGLLGLDDSESFGWDFARLPPETWLIESLYKPLYTPFLRAGQRRGNPVLTGLPMLVHQAVPAFETWHGVRPGSEDTERLYPILRERLGVKEEGLANSRNFRTS